MPRFEVKAQSNDAIVSKFEADISISITNPPRIVTFEGESDYYDLYAA